MGDVAWGTPPVEPGGYIGGGTPAAGVFFCCVFGRCGGILIDYLPFSIYYFGGRLRRISRRMRPFDRLRTPTDGFGMVGCWFCWGKMGKR